MRRLEIRLPSNHPVWLLPKRSRAPFVVRILNQAVLLEQSSLEKKLDKIECVLNNLQDQKAILPINFSEEMTYGDNMSNDNSPSFSDQEETEEITPNMISNFKKMCLSF